MASVVNRETKEYLSSVNTPQYSDPPWLINPDTSLVLNEEDQIPTTFWIIPDEGDLITADRVAWKKSIKYGDIELYRNDQLLGDFHYAPNGNDLTEGELYPVDTFNTPIFTGKVLAIVSGVPVDALWAINVGSHIQFTCTETSGNPGVVMTVEGATLATSLVITAV